MKNGLLIAATILAISSTAIATPSKPAKCPSADAIRAAGLSMDAIEQNQSDGSWAVGLMQSRYDTNDSWTFIVGRIAARNKNEAFERAKAALASLSFNQGPVLATRINRWECGYSNSAGFIAITVTPDLKGVTVNSAI